MDKKRKIYKPMSPEQFDVGHYDLKGTKTEIFLILIVGLIVILYLGYKHYAQPPTEPVEVQQGASTLPADLAEHAPPPISNPPKSPPDAFIIDSAIAKQIAALPEDTDPQRILKNYVTRHFKEHPGCKEYEAVLKDAKRYVEWAEADRAYMMRLRRHSAEDKKISAEIESIFGTDGSTFTERIRQMNDAEKETLQRQLEELQARNVQSQEQLDALKQEKPKSYEPMHTH